MSKSRILSVGQCGVDHPAISRFLGQSADAEVDAAETAREATDALRASGYDLVLVNRVFDRDGGSGLNLIRSIKSNPDLSGVSVMLVSNYEDAQKEAVDAGALPGFGKDKLGDPEVAGRVKEALAASEGT